MGFMLRMVFYLFGLPFAISILVSILAFNRVMHAGHPTSFSPSDPRLGFTKGPDSRGTINILWTCFSTIFTCVYVSLHLDVPFSKKKSQGWRGIFWSWMITIRRKASWIVINIIAPELVAYVAILEFLSARRGKEEMKKILSKHERGDKEWTLAHAFFVDMGGFKVSRFAVPSRGSSPKTTAAEDTGTGVETAGPTDSRSTESGECAAEQAQELKPETPLLSDASVGTGLGTEAARISTSEPVEGVILRNGQDLYKWLGENPEAAESIDYEQLGLDIEDRSKANSLLKTLTILQASWLVVQMIMRSIKGQPISELEVTTCAYVACTLVTYIFWWHKPYGVQRHILLHIPFSYGPGWVQDMEPTPFNRFEYAGGIGFLIATILSGCIGAVIGAIHCSLWNATFANSNGQLLWRICSIAQISAPMVMSLFLAWVALAVHYDFDSDWLGVCIVICSLFSCFIQFCARIVLFILVGYSFWSLPAGVYTETDWT